MGSVRSSTKYWLDGPRSVGNVHPGRAAIGQKATTVCGPKYAELDVPRSDQYLLYPTEDRWGQSDGQRAICFITDGGKTMTGSALN